MTTIALFNTEAKAIQYANEVHAWLQANRTGYNAVKWTTPIKATTEDLWYVKMPVENPQVTSLLQKQTETLAMPEIGLQCIINTYYLFKGDILKCRQTHNRTIYDPKDTPALFAFYRDNSDSLQWIVGEQVQVGWMRIYNNVKYEVIQAHQTQSDWTPNIATTLWKAYIEATPAIKPPQWNTANWAQYTPIGFEVFDLGKVWKVKTLSHTWIQPALTGNGAISWTFVKDWI